MLATGAYATSGSQQCKLTSVILADVSASIAQQAPQMHKAVTDVLAALRTLGPTGVAQFAETAKAVLEIADYGEINAVPPQLLTRGNLCVKRPGKDYECPPCHGTCTNLNKGLSISIDGLRAFGQAEENGNPPKAILIITDGRPNRGGPEMRSAVIEAAKKANVFMYFLVVNKNGNLLDRFFQPVQPADSPRFVNVKHVQNYADAVKIAASWVGEACSKANTPIEESTPVPIPSPKPEPVISMTYFPTSSIAIKDDYRVEDHEDFEKAAQSSQCKTAPVVYVRGFASPKGSLQFNVWLSIMRCSAAATALVKHGVDPAKIRIYAGGEDHGEEGADAIGPEEDADDARRAEIYCGCKPPSWVEMTTQEAMTKAGECTSSSCKGKFPNSPELGEKWAKTNKGGAEPTLPVCSL
jgi:outer membrane protein OmpA-like peptidoglycan-associated protein